MYFILWNLVDYDKTRRGEFILPKSHFFTAEKLNNQQNKNLTFLLN